MAVHQPSNAPEPSDNDLKSICSQLTLDEKISLLAGKNVWETPEIERLGVPSLRVTDGPNGARGGSFWDGTSAACFPACVSLAASFNPSLCEEVGKALGQEAQTKGAYVLLGPTVCGHRSPLGGRNFEGFSEDPYLSGSLAGAYVRGLQSERVAATVKHYLGNEQDTRRFVVNEKISERALREIYLRPFEKVVKEASPWAFMSSYPKINGKHVDASPKFIEEILRKQWHYDGVVMSDWGATTCVDSISHGLDLEMPGPARIRNPKEVRTALDSGSISTSNIDDRVLNNLRLLKRVGKFGDRRQAREEQAVDLPEHRALIRRAGAEGCVLLKNTNDILPLSGSELKRVALLGPLADYAAAHGGGSASLNCHYKISPLDAFKNRLGQHCEITHGKGAHIFRVLPEVEDGIVNKLGNPCFAVEYFMNKDMSTDAFRTEEAPRSSFSTLMNTNVTGSQSARFSTVYSPPTSGKHYLSFSSLGPAKLFINDELLHEQTGDTKDAMAFLLGVQDEFRCQYPFQTGQEYHIRIETNRQLEDTAELHLMNGQLSVHLGLVLQEEMEVDLLAEAVAFAKEAEYAILFVGNTVQWETEGQDLATMMLPADGSQDRLISAVAAANPRTIVVNTTGVAIETPWIDDVAAFVQAWYAGQETGNAILDVLLGEVTPSGKLPVSWPKKYEHTACYGNFGLDSYDSKEVEYVEGVYVGYRHFDRTYDTEREVRYPFGYGLSYTRFDISDASISGSISQDTQVSVTFTVKNTGTRAGAETVQVYLAPPSTSKTDRPPKALVGYAKVALDAGEVGTATVKFDKADAAYWDDATSKWQIEGGEHTITVSTSSSPRDAVATLALNVDAFSFEP